MIVAALIAAVVLFAEKSETEDKPKKKESAKPLPDAVVIDKDGSRTMTLPAASASTWRTSGKPESTAEIALKSAAA